MMDSIATETDANLITASMNNDFSAAFDCVCHKTLKDKLGFYGLDKQTTDWIHSYLEARSSFVAIGSAQSRITCTPNGVPQGLVLGPLMYLIYVNEMPSVTEDRLCENQVYKQWENLFPRECHNCGKFPMYADDGQFPITSNNRFFNQDKLEENF